VSACPARAYYYVPPTGEGDPYCIAQVGPFSSAPNAITRIYMTEDAEEAAAWRESLAAGELPAQLLKAQP
jgi:hypothetical protein